MTARSSASTPSVGLAVCDGLAVVLLSLAAASSFREAYGGTDWLVAMGGGTVLGLACAWAGARFKLGPWGSVLLLGAAYFALGATLALPSTTSRLPSLEALRDLTTGLVGAWRDSLTLATPLGDRGDVLIVPLVIGLVAGLAGATLLWRSPWPGSVSIVLAGVFVATATFGDLFSEQTTGRGLLVLLGTVVWLRLRASRHIQGGWARRVALTALVVVAAGAVGGGVARSVESDADRAVLREQVQPPFDPRDYPSPLSRFRAYKKDLDTAPLLEVRGLPDDARVRIATMDTFDGIVWNVSGGPDDVSASASFEHIGRGRPEAGDVEVTFTIEDGYSGVWLPSVGDESGVIIESGPRGGEIFHNAETGTMAQVGGTTPGTVYRLTTRVAAVPTAAEILDASTTATRDPERSAMVPERLAQLSDAWAADAGADTAGALAAAVATTLHDNGYYSNGLEGDYTSASGHGKRRIDDLVARPTWVGDEEQYSSAMGAVLQRFGLPARVVIGFRPAASNVVLTGDDVTAWVEVRLDGLGWVAFDPTPEQNREPRKTDNDPDPRPQPQVLPPPDTPVEAEEDLVDVPRGGSSGGVNTTSDDQTAGGGVLRVVQIVAGTTGASILLLSPFWVVALLKSRRRRRRRLEADPVTRLSGGWRELADHARDLGVPLGEGTTRYETSRLLVDRFPRSEAHVLALRADRHTFGPGHPTDDEIAAYWADVDSAARRMREAVPLWWRLLHRFSWASLSWRAGLSRVSTSVRARGTTTAASLRERVSRTREED